MSEAQLTHVISDESPEVHALLWGPRGPVSHAYQSLSGRFLIQYQRSDAQMGADLVRRDKLQELGIYSSELDSRSFARSLVKALADQLSIRDLEHIVDEFSLELQREESARLVAMSRFPDVSNPSA